MVVNIKNLNSFLVFYFYFGCKFATIGLKCGTSMHSQGFIIGGTTVNRGDYPWIAALINLTTQKFFCSGTLIADSHILTAAHCINSKGTQNTLSPQDLVVLLGKHNLNFKIERGSVTLYVDQIHIHPDWKFHTDNYDADIAILKLKQPVTFTEYIFPICWPARSDDGNIFEGKVVGWGESDDDKKPHEDIPKELQVDSITNEACFLSFHQFAIISSNRTFCAGAENAGPCFGDSGKKEVSIFFIEMRENTFVQLPGGGLFVKKNSNWIIRGIVSSSFVEKGKCDVKKYAVYTNVINFTNWMREIIIQTESIRSYLDDVIGPDVEEDNDHHITIDCGYGYRDNIHAIPLKTLYSCYVEQFDTPLKHSIAHIHGKHRDGLSNQDVQEFILNMKSDFPYIPMNIGRIFPNLELFFIGQGSLQSIERKNFEGMSKVSSFFVGFNDLVDLPKDVFYELFNVQALFIDNNKIKSLHRDLLVKMPKLQKFIAHNNQIEYLDAGLFRRNSQLKFVNLLNNQLKTIKVDFKLIREIEHVDLTKNQCIDSRYSEQTSIDDFQQIITKNCNN